MWNVTLLVTGVAMSEQIANSLGFWITYNMAGFRHFVSVHKMKDGNMARLILSKWRSLCKIAVKIEIPLIKLYIYKQNKSKQRQSYVSY